MVMEKEILNGMGDLENYFCVKQPFLFNISN
jgi:hypothetical protein